MSIVKSLASLALAAFLAMIGGTAEARFVSVDPVNADVDTGQNFNRYYYANDNPYRYVDPDGRQAAERQAEQYKRDAESGNRGIYRPFEKPAIAVTAIMAAPVIAVVGWEAGMAMMANPGAVATMAEVAGGAAGMTGMGTGLARTQTTAVVTADRTAQALSSILRPNGQLVGNAVGGATSEVRTVSPAAFGSIRQSLSNLGAVEGGGASSYRGSWYSLPNGQGGFGVRNANSGPTMDMNIPGFPKGFKIHQGD
jgi:hypothetical protein